MTIVNRRKEIRRAHQARRVPVLQQPHLHYYRLQNCDRCPITSDHPHLLRLNVSFTAVPAQPHAARLGTQPEDPVDGRYRWRRDCYYGVQKQNSDYAAVALNGPRCCFFH